MMSAARRLDWLLIAVVCLLALLGCIAIARAAQLELASSSFLTRQGIWVAASAVAMVVTARTNYRVIGRWNCELMVLAMALLVAVYLFPPVNGARRWIRFGPVSVQPSEFAKLAYVLVLARYLMYRESYRRLPGLLAPLVLTLIPMLLILKEPDLGTALIFLPVLFAMLMGAGARLRHLAIVSAAGVCLLPVLWSQMSREQRSRITALAEQTAPHERPTDDGYHLHQAKQMLAFGGSMGSWLAPQQIDGTVYSVPEAHTDSVFTIVVERFGLWGAGLLVGLYVVLVWRCLAIAESTREPFGRLVALGVGSLIAVQVLINTGMMVGLLPITGLALPLVSYGGSSLLATSLGLGLVLSVGLRPGYEVTRDPFRFAD